MNIVYTTNDGFCAKVGTSICSVFENNKDIEDITVYVIGQNISNDNTKKFERLAETYNRTISIIPLNNLQQYIPFDYDTLGWHEIVLARLIIDHLLPEDVHRVIYMDGDTCNINSLKELWEYDLQGNPLGGCMEPTVQSTRYAEINTEGIPYINAGVLLIDLDEWRKNKWGDVILQFYKDHNGKLFANDQDAINGALHGRITYLPPKYNFFNIYWFYPYRYLKHLNKGMPYYDKDLYDESLKNPAIIHYLGEERPWRKGNHHKFKEDYLKYLQMTEWKDDPMEEGWTTYYVCWDIFNVLTHPFPGLRHTIINGLIPAFMKWRKKQREKGTK